MPGGMRNFTFDPSTLWRCVRKKGECENGEFEPIETEDIWRLFLRSKRIAIVLSVLFVIGLLPILYLSGYVHATGDDFEYGSRAHQAWLASHNLGLTFAAAAETVKQFWYGWQGTFYGAAAGGISPGFLLDRSVADVGRQYWCDDADPALFSGEKTAAFACCILVCGSSDPDGDDPVFPQYKVRYFLV